MILWTLRNPTLCNCVTANSDAVRYLFLFRI